MSPSLSPRGLTDENGLIDYAIPFPMIVLLVGMVVIVIGAIFHDLFARSGPGQNS
jgi:hypothetical protein